MTELKRRILLTGATGQLGGQLLSLLQGFGQIAAPARQELNLYDADSICRSIREIRPHWIVNAAAYTSVDNAEGEAEGAFAVNAASLRVLGEEAVQLGIPVIHFSTDYVFDGSGAIPWTEHDAPHPLNVYGASKLAGEQALAGTNALHIIFRTSWLYGATGHNFLRSILQSAWDKKEIAVVTDQHGAPTWSNDLARMVLHAIQWTERSALEDRCAVTEALRRIEGVYHACGSGTTTRFGFAEEILRIVQQTQPNTRLAKLIPTTTVELHAAAQRPLNSRLDCSKLKRRLGFAMPDWKLSLVRALAAMRPTRHS